MRLGSNSRYVLELLAAFGLEVVEGILSLPHLHRAATFSSDRTFQNSARLLERQRLIRIENADKKAKWVATLTEEGRSAVNGGFDPVACWDEPWDGKWRLFSFDLPCESTAPRQSLRKWLKVHRFGRLQGSVWITPRELNDWPAELAKLAIAPKSVVFMSGSFGPQRDQAAYAESGWDFPEINRRYQAYLEFLAVRSPEHEKSDAFPSWFRREVELWRAAFGEDPFLPKALWTDSIRSSYLGPQALEARRHAYSHWSARLFVNLS